VSRPSSPSRRTIRPRASNPYGESKLAFERALAWYGGAMACARVSLRYFNAAGASARAGERHDPETPPDPIVLQAAADGGTAVTIHGDDYPTRDGTCVRDYVHVLDLAEAPRPGLDALAAGAPPRPTTSAAAATASPCAR
jgi:UDP-glucose 4-epimerase